jgi:hypothetical protein
MLIPKLALQRYKRYTGRSRGAAYEDPQLQSIHRGGLYVNLTDVTVVERRNHLFTQTGNFRFWSFFVSKALRSCFEQLLEMQRNIKHCRVLGSIQNGVSAWRANGLPLPNPPVT